MIQIKKEIRRTVKSPYNTEDACYVECEIYDFGNLDSVRTVEMPISQFELIQTLNRLQKTTDIYPSSMDAIWKLILNFATFNSNDGLSQSTIATGDTLNTKKLK